MTTTTVNAGVLTANDISQLGYASLANFLKNKPIDQISQQRPLLKALMAKKKPYGGGGGGYGYSAPAGYCQLPMSYGAPM